MGSFAWMRVLESSAERYDRGIRWLSRGRMDEVYRDVAEAATSGRAAARVLDIGCGTGGLTLACAARGARVVGIDRNAGMLAVARAKPLPAGARGTVRWLELGAAEIEDAFVPGSFDAVVACLAFSEMTDDEQGYVLEVARTRLVAGGRLILADEVRPRQAWQRAWHAVRRWPVAGLAYLLTQTGTRPVEGLPERVRHAGFVEVREERRWGDAFAIVYSRAPAATGLGAVPPEAARP
ncbi:MAG: class I SAM-dependent methyltransferase [Deinococcales bacterium]